MAATAADLGYAGLLLGDGASAVRFVARTLGPVIRHDERRSTALMETLEAYFATGQSLVASAKRLHIHPNTVTQRLDRVRRLLGVDWNSPDHMLEVQLALRLHRVRGGRAGRVRSGRSAPATWGRAHAPGAKHCAREHGTGASPLLYHCAHSSER